ncbi:hypothetical protein RHOFW510R12_06800 [Rhodanobacter sp. FW510-R12]
MLAELGDLLPSLLFIDHRCIARCRGFIAFTLGGGQLRFQRFPLFGKRPLSLFHSGDPKRSHGVGHRRWQIRSECIDLRSLVLPQLQLIIDGGSAALLDGRIDLVDGDFVGSFAAGNELGSGFTGTLAGIADTAHG